MICSTEKQSPPDDLRAGLVKAPPTVDAKPRSRIIIMNPEPPPFRSELETQGHWCIIFSKGKIQVRDSRTRCAVRTEGSSAVRARTHEEQCGWQLLPNWNPSIIFLLIP